MQVVVNNNNFDFIWSEISAIGQREGKEIVKESQERFFLLKEMINNFQIPTRLGSR